MEGGQDALLRSREEFASDVEYSQYLDGILNRVKQQREQFSKSTERVLEVDSRYSALTCSINIPLLVDGSCVWAVLSNSQPHCVLLTEALEGKCCVDVGYYGEDVAEEDTISVNFRRLYGSYCTRQIQFGEEGPPLDKLCFFAVNRMTAERPNEDELLHMVCEKYRHIFGVCRTRIRHARTDVFTALKRANLVERATLCLDLSAVESASEDADVSVRFGPSGEYEPDYAVKLYSRQEVSSLPPFMYHVEALQGWAEITALVKVIGIFVQRTDGVLSPNVLQAPIFAMLDTSVSTCIFSKEVYDAVCGSLRSASPLQSWSSNDIWTRGRTSKMDNVSSDSLPELIFHLETINGQAVQVPVKATSYLRRFPSYKTVHTLQGFIHESAMDEEILLGLDAARDFHKKSAVLGLPLLLGRISLLDYERNVLVLYDP